MSLFFLDKQEVVEKIDCLAVNVGQSQLLVPMPAVAEIVLNQARITSDKLPAWVAGWIEWRHLNIPLIDFTAVQLNRDAKDFGASTRILVLNSYSEGHSHRYYAIMTKGFPHTISVEASTDMTSQGAEDLGNCVKIDLAVQGEDLLLPDFQEIEAYLKQIPLYF